MKYFSSILILMLSISCTKAPDPSKPSKAVEHGIGIVVAPSGLNLRTEPDAQSKTITTLAYTTHVQLLEQKSEYATVTGYSGKWTRVQAGNQSGWVLAADKLLAQTDPLDQEFFTAKERGSELKVGPLDTSETLTKLPYGSRVQVLTDEFQAGEVTGWYFATIDGKRGYLRASDLTTVSYPLEKFKDGPFVGLKSMALPEICRRGSGGMISTNGSEDFFLQQLTCNEEGGYALVKISSRIGRNVEQEILQIITPTTQKPEIVVLGSPGLHDVMCGDSAGKSIPLAIVNLHLATPKLDKDKIATYSGVVVKYWAFDKDSQLLKESLDPKAGCVIPPASMFD